MARVTRYETWLALGKPEGIFSIWLEHRLWEYFDARNDTSARGDQRLFERRMFMAQPGEDARFDTWLGRVAA